jgi:chemotaxis family two-component system sensor kinase Cph1
VVCGVCGGLVVDVSECDREPIHIPGSIQPFGVLLALSEPDMVVTQISDNASDHLCMPIEAILGHSLSSFMAEAAIDELRRTLREQRWHTDNPLEVVIRGRRFDAIVHRHEGVPILELEPATEPDHGLLAHYPFRAALIRTQHASTLAELADVIVEEMQRITGYDRVLFYRFHEDGSGSVDAEARGRELDPYLGLRYPASDIPAQARRLYQLNWLRLIFDADQKPARLVPPRRPDTGGPLDLTFSVLRSVSPIHLEYMKNMGVRASMSISLVVRGRLWGLITCLHHSAPRRVSYAIRSGCEFLGRLASLQIAAFEDRDRIAARGAVRGIEEALQRVMRAASADDVLAALVAQPAELLGLVNAHGAAVVTETEVLTCGKTPPVGAIRELATWLANRAEPAPFATSSISPLFPSALAFAEVASGLLTFALSRSRLLWFRPEVVQTVHWGGEHGEPAAPGERLRPRNSFALWKQEVRARSDPWATNELDTADELRRRAIEVEVERRLVAEQRAVRVRDDILAVVSHDLRNPLGVIGLQTEMLSTLLESDGNEPARLAVERIARSTARITSLVDGLLDLGRIEAGTFSISRRHVASRDIVSEAVEHASPLAEAKHITLVTEMESAPTLEVDPARVSQVLANLLGNAIKFTPEGGKVEIHAERRDGELSVAVVDSGPGIAPEHVSHLFDRYWKADKAGTGLGLYIARGIVEAHGGRISVDSTSHGAAFTFTLPLEPKRNDKHD